MTTVDPQALLRLVTIVLMVWAALVGTASVVVHLRVFDPTSPISRHLLGYMTAIAVVLDLSVLALLPGDTVWFQLIRLVAFAAVPIFMTQRLILQLRAQRENRTDTRGGADGQADLGDRPDRR
jgi:hypothetical protein